MIINLLLLIVTLSPLPFGSNRPWAWSLISLLLALLTLAFCTHLIKRKSHPGLDEIKASVVLFVLVLLWVAFQASGLPPVAWHHPIWDSAGRVLGMPLHAAISLNPEQTYSALMKLLGYGLVFVLAFHYCRSFEIARRVFRCLSWGGFLYATYALIVYFGDFNTILWYPKWSSIGDATATFINRNNYATYAGLTLLCSVALLLDELSSSSHYDFSGFWGMQMLLELLITRSWLPLLILCTTGTALLLAHSRGGFLSTLAATCALLAVLNINRQSRHIPVAAGLLGACLVALTVFLSGGKAVMERIDQLSLESETRDEVYRLTLSAIADNPWLGIGYGAFEDGFRLYKNETVAALRYDKAHNTYLENMFELGVPVALMLFAAVFRLAWVCLRGVFRRRRHWAYPATGFAASVLVAVHSVTDFSLQIPAVAMTYALLLGTACAQAFPSLPQAGGVRTG
ncbi:MAG: O-antigen ligase family protein [Gammaproteobacteria bacterium]